MALYYTHSSGPDHDARMAAFGKVVELAKQLPSPVFTIAVHMKANLDVAYEGILDRGLVKELQKHGRVTDPSTGAICLHTGHGRKPLAMRGPVIVLDGDPSLLASVLGDRNATDVVYVPWTDKDLDAARAANPTATCIYAAPTDATT